MRTIVWLNGKVILQTWMRPSDRRKRKKNLGYDAFFKQAISKLKCISLWQRPKKKKKTKQKTVTGGNN